MHSTRVQHVSKTSLPKSYQYPSHNYSEIHSRTPAIARTLPKSLLESRTTLLNKIPTRIHHRTPPHHCKNPDHNAYNWNPWCHSLTRFFPIFLMSLFSTIPETSVSLAFLGLLFSFIALRPVDSLQESWSNSLLESLSDPQTTPWHDPDHNPCNNLWREHSITYQTRLSQELRPEPITTLPTTRSTTICTWVPRNP